MTNNAKLTTDTAIVIKLVEITGQRPLSASNRNGQKFIAGRGEAAIFARRGEKAGVDLTREVEPCELLPNLYVSKHGHGMFAVDAGSKNVEAPTHVAFIPVQKGLDEDQRAYDAELHLASLQAVLKQALALDVSEGVKAKAGDITLRMTPPGTYEGRDVSDARTEELAAWLKERGIHVQWQTATADLPEGERSTFKATEPVNYGEFQVSRGDMYINGSRRLRTQRVSEALRNVGKMLVQAQKPSRVIVPLSVGANLAMAEAAQAAGVPVVLAYIGSQPETWMPDNRARLNALQQAGAVIIGDMSREFEEGLFSASIEHLAERVLSVEGKVALMTEDTNTRGEGARLRGKPGVANLFPQVTAYLRSQVGDAVVDKELAVRAEPVVNANKAAISAEEVPF